MDQDCAQVGVGGGGGGWCDAGPYTQKYTDYELDSIRFDSIKRYCHYAEYRYNANEMQLTSDNQKCKCGIIYRYAGNGSATAK